jgi:hypothetical protein
MPQGLPALTKDPASGGVRPLIVVVCSGREHERFIKSEANFGTKPKKVCQSTGLFAKNPQSRRERVRQRGYGIEQVVRFRKFEE